MLWRRSGRSTRSRWSSAEGASWQLLERACDARHGCCWLAVPTSSKEHTCSGSSSLWSGASPTLRGTQRRLTGHRVPDEAALLFREDKQVSISLCLNGCHCVCVARDTAQPSSPQQPLPMRVSRRIEWPLTCRQNSSYPRFCRAPWLVTRHASKRSPDRPWKALRWRSAAG